MSTPFWSRPTFKDCDRNLENPGFQGCANPVSPLSSTQNKNGRATSREAPARSTPFERKGATTLQGAGVVQMARHTGLANRRSPVSAGAMRVRIPPSALPSVLRYRNYAPWVDKSTHGASFRPCLLGFSTWSRNQLIRQSYSLAAPHGAVEAPNDFGGLVDFPITATTTKRQRRGRVPRCAGAGLRAQ